MSEKGDYMTLACDWLRNTAWLPTTARVVESEVDRKQKVLPVFGSESIMGNEVHQDQTVNSAHLTSK